MADLLMILLWLGFALASLGLLLVLDRLGDGEGR